jgi:hypothetical protein
MHLSWPAVCVRRLARHGLAAPVDGSRMAEQIGVICGAHAQVMAAAELSIGLRVEGVTRTTVQQALWTDRTLVKAYGPRGTVHLLPANELPIWTGALSATPARYGGMPANVRMTPEQTDDVVAAIADALDDAELTIDELSAEVIARTGAWAGDLVMPAFNGYWPRWRQAVTLASHRGTLCFGPNRGRNVTYTSPGRWLPGFEPADGQTALAEVVRRYLFAYGPATPRQFAQWLGVPRPWAADLFASLSEDLQPVALDESEAWVVAGDTEVQSDPSGLRLLPYFDAYVVGCHPRDLLFPGPSTERALAGGQAGTVPVLLIDGVVSGVWHQRRSGRRLAITVEPFGALTAHHRRELDEQVERVGEIMEGRPELTIGEVTVGKHL